MSGLKSLDALNAAGLVGVDATTSLDTFIRRAADYFGEKTGGMNAEERNVYLSNIFGSDAVRAASVLSGGAR